MLVLGAGLAGLGAATRLHGSGKSFLILEGQPTAGGRVNTCSLHDLATARTTTTTNANDDADDDADDPDATNFVDSGAQWLHGRHNHLHTVAERHGLLSDEQSEEGLGAFIRDDGHVLDDYLVRRTDFLVGQILADCEKYARNEGGSDVSDTTAAGYPTSVRSFLLERFQAHLDGLRDADERRQAEQLLDWHERFQVIDNSCLSLADVSALGWGRYSYNGESCQAHYNFRRGFGSAVRALVADIGAERFRFGRDCVRVERIDARTGDDRRPLVRVRCAGGERFHARHVVCTFSLGSLKYGVQQQQPPMFEPALPPATVQAIADIGFGTINKLFLQFERAWWEPLEGIQLVFGGEAGRLDNGGWTRDISGFDVLRPGPPCTLLAWVGGPGARAMEALSDEEIVADLVRLLERFTGRRVPQPRRYFCTRWGGNRFVRGAYSFISTRCDRSGWGSDVLGRPVTAAEWGGEGEREAKNGDGDAAAGRKPLLLFAGEAVHERYFSTAHGAFLSGIEQADRVLDFYQIA